MASVVKELTMEFTFLGTSSGTPTKQRNLTGLALRGKSAKRWYLVDCGEGTQHQLLHTYFTIASLEAIFITHVHGDHCYGLPGILGSAAMSGRTAPLVIVAPAEIQTLINAIIQTSRLWLDFELKFIDVATLKEPLVFADFGVEPVTLSHRVPCYGYHFVENNIEHSLNTAKLIEQGIAAGPIWGRIHKGEDITLDDGQVLHSKDFIITDRKPRVLTVGGDNDNPQLLANVSVKPNVVIHEATYTADVAAKVGPGPQHSSAKIVAEYAQQAAIKHLILTHFSPRYAYARQAEPSIRDVESEAREYYKGELFLANDLDSFEIDKTGNLHKVQG
ncbi:MAG: ribonuclease Z [Alteromonadaceae bacterium]|jgi:ribonuclease Z